jgi:PAS domain S-box-containing protein
MTALTLMSEATLVLDEHGGVVAANDLAQEMFGYGGEAIAGQPVTQLMPLAMPLADVQEEGGPPRRMKLAGRRANGVPFPVEASVRWVDADEKTQALCAVRELRYGALVTEAQRYFDAAFDHSPIGMALFNSDAVQLRRRVRARQRRHGGADGAVGAAAARPPRSGVHAPRGPAVRRRRRLGDPQRQAQHAPDREALPPP